MWHEETIKYYLLINDIVMFLQVDIDVIVVSTHTDYPINKLLCMLGEIQVSIFSSKLCLYCEIIMSVNL